MRDGIKLGTTEGSSDGIVVGTAEGLTDGRKLGTNDGCVLGKNVLDGSEKGVVSVIEGSCEGKRSVQ